MKSNYLIKSTSTLKVDKIDRNTYFVSTPIYRGLSVPKLKYQGNTIENLKLTGINGHLKSILVNSAVFCVIVLLGNFINPKGSLTYYEMTLVIIGIVLFFYQFKLCSYLLHQIESWTPIK